MCASSYVLHDMAFTKGQGAGAPWHTQAAEFDV